MSRPAKQVYSSDKYTGPPGLVTPPVTEMAFGLFYRTVNVFFSTPMPVMVSDFQPLGSFVFI